MNLSQAALGNLCNVLAGIGLVASGTAGWAIGAGAFQSLVGGVGLVAALRQRGQAGPADTLESFRRAVEGSWRAWAATNSRDPGAQRSAIASFNDYFGDVGADQFLDRDLVAGIRREVLAEEPADPVAVTAERVAMAMLNQAAVSHEWLYANTAGNQLARSFFIDVVGGALNLLLRDDAYRAALAPAILDLIADDAAAIRSTTERSDAKLDAILARLDGIEGLSLRAARQLALDFDAARPDATAAEIETFLRQKSVELRELQVQLRRLSNDDPTVAALRAAAAADIETGAFEDARAKLLDARAVDRQAREDLEDRARQRRLSEATSAAELAALARLRLAYRDAAALYGEAHDLVGAADPDAAWSYLLQQGNALYVQGEVFGDKVALVETIGVFERAGDLRPRAMHANDWAMTRCHIANALSGLGNRNRDEHKLHLAVVAFGEVLEIYNEACTPREWATTFRNLGAALGALADIQCDLDASCSSSRLARYVLRQYLRVFRRDGEPLLWAATQADIATASLNIGEKKQIVAYLKSAICRLQVALQIFEEADA